MTPGAGVHSGAKPLFPLKGGGHPVRFARKGEIVDVLERERQAGYCEEPLPADTIDPFAVTLVLVGILGIDFYQVLHGLDDFGPARRIVRKVRDGELGHAGRSAGVGHLAAHKDGDAVTGAVRDRKRRTHGVAVAAVHAALFLDLHRLRRRVRADGARGARRDRRRDLALVPERRLVHLRGLSVNAQDGYVGAVDRTAHIEAAGQGDPDARRKLRSGEVLMELIHDRLHDARGVRCRRMAMHPALGMHHVADAVADAAHEMAALLEVRHQSVHFVLCREELDVVPGRPAQMPAGIFLGDVAHLTDEVRGDETGCGYAHGIELIAGLGDVLHGTVAHHFVIFPLSVVLRDHGRQEFMIIRCTNVCYSLRFVSHYRMPALVLFSVVIKVTSLHPAPRTRRDWSSGPS